MAKLKVYVTPIGFHDAYVAAPSQKAALEAWGSDHNLLARGVAQIVTDPKLMAEPLEKPGAVIKRLRGTAAEQIAALPPDKPKKPAARKPAAEAKPRRAPKPRPLPDRSELDAVEAALSEEEARHRQQADEIEAQIATLRADLSRARDAHERTVAKLEKARARADAAYRRKLDQYRSG